MFKKTATLAVMALISISVSIPVVEAGVGGCGPRSGVGGCLPGGSGTWTLSAPTVDTQVSETPRPIEDFLPVYVRIMSRIVFGRPGTTPAPAPAGDNTTLGVGGCGPRAGVGGCKL